ncbi:MAG TPA: GAF domain-containing protein [Thioploca sp.]|nr:GAF domain-containing protein [Thioploca sp.]
MQDWLKTGQTQLSEQVSGEQDVITLSKNIITFLTTYLEAQVCVFYLLEEVERFDAETEQEDNTTNAHLKLIASYAYTQRKGVANEISVGEGLVGQAALEKQRIIVTEVPENYIHIQSGLGETVPRNLLVIPFMYENAVKGVIEMGSVHELTEVQLELLEQVMPNIGIAMNTAESRTKMQALLSMNSEQ